MYEEINIKIWHAPDIFFKYMLLNNYARYKFLTLFGAAYVSLCNELKLSNVQREHTKV
jgi:hypothetical protein